MARVKLKLPEQSLFQTTLRVRVTDLNYGAHLSNVALLGFAHEARVRWLQSNGYSELEIEGMGLIQADAEIRYMNQSYLGDQILITLYLGDWLSRGFELMYSLARTEGGDEIARVKTGLVFFDYKTQKVGKIPPAFKERISAIS